jgi:PilZ domain
MSFDTNARRQAKELFDALMDRLVKDLSAAAREETEAAAVATRKEADAAVAAAEKEADATVAATRKDAEATVAAARKDAEAAIVAARKEADATVAAARKEAEAKAAKARVEAEKVAESQLATARAEGEARLAAAQAMNSGLMESIEGARQEVKAFEARLQQLEKERTQLLQARDEFGALVESEKRRANELAEALEAAVQETNLAKQTASLSKVEADARRQDRELALDRFGASLRTIDRANSPSEILDALLDPLAQDFSKAAVFLVGTAGLKGWRGRGLGTNDITKLVIQRGSDSLLTRAVTTRKRVQVSANGGEQSTGLWGGPVAVALPIQAGDGVIAVAYAEDAEETSSQGVGRKITEMLIKHAALRLTMKSQAPARPSTGAAAPQTAEATQQPAQYSPARQARRLKTRDDIEVVLDGSASSLVDISSIGAQVLSPLALRPNRVVKMTLRGDESAMACKVRVMWARFEPKGTAAAQYRVGVKFTDVEPKDVEAFMAKHGIEDTGERAKAAKLQDSA